MLKKLSFAFVVTCLTSLTALAHPVSFKDGYGVMPEYTPDRQEIELNYSVTSNYAIGVYLVDASYKGSDATYIIPRFNYKLYRKNELESQTNLYVSGGAGTVDYKGEDDLAGFAMFRADYETRRIYTLLSGQTLQSSGESDINALRYRAGFAPYLAGFNDLNTWLIAQVEYLPESEDEWVVTPLVRLFYSNYLVEIGSSTKGDLFFAGIFHF